MLSRTCALGTGLIVPCGAAADAVDDSDEGKNTAVENGEISPLLPYVRQHSSFARIAPVAPRLLLVAPFSAIALSRRTHRPRFRHRPERRILELESTLRRRLTAPGLHQNVDHQNSSLPQRYVCIKH